MPSLVENGPVVLEKKIFEFSLMYFCYFVIISTLKRGESLHLNNLNPLYLLMLCAKFGWNWSSGSGEEDEKCGKFSTTPTTTTTRRQRRRTMDKSWSEKLNWAFGEGELKKIGLMLCYYIILSKIYTMESLSPEQSACTARYTYMYSFKSNLYV